MQTIKQNETVANRLEVALLAIKTADDTGYTSNLLNSEIKLVKPNGSAVNATNGSTHISNGLHRFLLTQAEVDTLGVLKIQLNQATCYGDIKEVQIVAYDPYSVTNLGLSNLDAAISSRLATTSYENTDAFLDKTNAIETGVTPRGALRLMLAVLAGKLSGAGTGTEIFRNAVADTKNRVSASVDTSGNRTTITTDQT